MGITAWSSLGSTSGFDDAFVTPGNVLAYFFKGSEYVAVDISGSSTRVLQGYPKPIVFHVGTQVASFPAPNIWGSGEFGDY